MIGTPRYPVVARRVAAQPEVWRWTFAGLPPALNNTYSTGTHGKRFLTTQAREWKQAAVGVIVATSIGLVLPSEPLAIHIRLYPGNKRKWDVDGRQKLVLDALVESGLLDDDNYERVAFVSSQVVTPQDGAARVELAVETFARWRQRDGQAGLWS